MALVRIEQEQSEVGGRYVARIVGIAGEAELGFTRKSPRLVSADHTNAPDALRSTGAATALVDRLIADARAEGFQIIPACPHVREQAARHHE